MHMSGQWSSSNKRIRDLDIASRHNWHMWVDGPNDIIEADLQANSLQSIVPNELCNPDGPSDIDDNVAA